MKTMSYDDSAIAVNNDTKINDEHIFYDDNF